MKGYLPNKNMFKRQINQTKYFAACLMNLVMKCMKI